MQAFGAAVRRFTRTFYAFEKNEHSTLAAEGTAAFITEIAHKFYGGWKKKDDAQWSRVRELSSFKRNGEGTAPLYTVA